MTTFDGIPVGVFPNGTVFFPFHSGGRQHDIQTFATMLDMAVAAQMPQDLIIVGHGKPSRLHPDGEVVTSTADVDGRDRELTGMQVAGIVKELRTQPMRRIYLDVCFAGRDDHGFSRQLADELGAVVRGAKGVVTETMDLSTIDLKVQSPTADQWRDFIPGTGRIVELPPGTPLLPDLGMTRDLT